MNASTVPKLRPKPEMSFSSAFLLASGSCRGGDGGGDGGDSIGVKVEAKRAVDERVAARVVGAMAEGAQGW